MRRHRSGVMRVIATLIGSASIAAVLALASLARLPVSAQTQQAGGEAFTPHKTPDGQPDIQGVWTAFGLSGTINSGVTTTVPGGGYRQRDWTGRESELERKNYELERAKRESEANRTWELYKKGMNIIPYQPWAFARWKQILAYNYETGQPVDGGLQANIDPIMRCLPPGVPRFTPQVILQPPGFVVMITGSRYRTIPVDGRPHVGDNIRLWMGDSRGRWEGNTLVVETTNFNGKTWMDMIGSFHSDALRVVERFTIADADALNYEATLEDPKVFTQRWQLKHAGARFGATVDPNKPQGFKRKPKLEDLELLEDDCREGGSAARSLNNVLSVKR